MNKIITNKELNKLGNENTVIHIIKETGWTLINLTQILKDWDRKSFFCMIQPTRAHIKKEKYTIKKKITVLLNKLINTNEVSTSKITRNVGVYQEKIFGKKKYKNLLYQIRIRYMFNLYKKGKTIVQIYKIMKTFKFQTIYKLLNDNLGDVKIEKGDIQKYIKLESKKYYKVLPNNENDEYQKWPNRKVYDEFVKVSSHKLWQKTNVESLLLNHILKSKRKKFELIGFGMGFNWRIVKNKEITVFKQNVWNNEKEWIETRLMKIPKEETIALIMKYFK